MWNNEKFKERRIVHKHYGFEYFIIGCDKSSVTAEKAKEDSKEDSKEDQKRAFKNVRYVSY